MAESTEDRIQIGWVSKAHGLSGEVEVQLNWASSLALSKLEEVVVTSKKGVACTRKILQVRKTPKGFLVCLEGVTGRTAGEALKGSLIGVPRSALPELGTDEYYLRDLVGVRVVAPDGPVGKVVEVHVYPSVDAVEIELPGGRRTELPLLDEWVESVDIAKGELRIITRDGLIESEQKKTS